MGNFRKPWNKCHFHETVCRVRKPKLWLYIFQSHLPVVLCIWNPPGYNFVTDGGFQHNLALFTLAQIFVLMRLFVGYMNHNSIIIIAELSCRGYYFDMDVEFRQKKKKNKRYRWRALCRENEPLLYRHYFQTKSFAFSFVPIKFLSRLKLRHSCRLGDFELHWHRCLPLIRR